MSISNIGVSAENHRAARFISFITAEIGGHVLVYALIFLLLIETAAVSWLAGDSLLPFVSEYADRAARAVRLLLSGGIIVVICVAMLQGRDSPIRYLKDASLHLWRGTALPRYAYACALLTLFFAAFLYNKMLIPKLNGFQWDSVFAEWDLLLFGGRQPWELLHPLLSTPTATIFLDIMYSLWVPLVFLFWCLSFASSNVPAQLRHTYWLATTASWILIGLVMATILSSAGPCYFAELHPELPSPYAGLNDYLASVNTIYPLGSSLTKEHLWAVYGGTSDLPGGISAMPSMHNAQAVLFAALAYRLDRRLGHLMLAYTIIIFVASIHLAWHYAVDGIVGALCALIIWWIAGVIVRQGNARRGYVQS